MFDKSSLNESSEKSRLDLLEECLKLKLPVEKNDDFELLQLILEAARERKLGISESLEE